jgi:cupin fold WbuC family metalloprotein
MKDYFDRKFFDELDAQAQASPRLRMNFDLRNSAADQSQRMFNALQPGTVLPIHRHPTTTETVIVIRGSFTEVFFDNDGRETARYLLDPAKGLHGLNIPVGQWHTLVVHEPSVLIEVKDGPYAPITDADILTPKA